MLERIHLISRRDTLLVAGLITAVLVIFTESIQRLLDTARQIEETYGLSLIPALVILTVVLIFHEQTKRQEMKTIAAAAEAEARQARKRAAELELMVALGQSVARALDVATLRERIWRQLPRLAGQRETWILVRRGLRWESLAGAAHGSTAQLDPAVEAWADALPERLETGASLGADLDGHVCFPLVAGERLVGVMGIACVAAPVTGEERRVLAAAAALIAIAVKNVQLFDELRENGLRDALTGCFNKAHAVELIDTELRRARRSQQPVSLVMFDIDHFKAINDRYGHPCGDAVLAAVGRHLGHLLRTSDHKCRYGGEEFLIVLPETPLGGAARVAEWLCTELAALEIPWAGRRIPVTASFGVASARAGEGSVEMLIGRADAALYRAKQEGRDCVRLDEERPPRGPAASSAAPLFTVVASA